MKYIIFDSGPLINFAMNGLLPLFKKLRKQFSGKFIITPEVKKEIIERPQTIKKFQLGALQLKALFDEKIIELPNLTSQQKVQLEKKKIELLNIANRTYRTKSKNLHLKLIGDFDGSSALELINMLKENYSKSEKIVIDTRGLCSVHPFGRDVFWKNCTGLNNKSRNVIFTGANSNELSQESNISSS